VPCLHFAICEDLRPSNLRFGGYQQGFEMALNVEDWYKQMPIITRSYLTLSVLITAGCASEIISPYSLYLNANRVAKHWEVWRLVTNFFSFGELDLDFLFHMFFLAWYCKLLEEIEGPNS
jgi:Derlin-2/3